ncbi:uncharacterized protein LOC117321988 isoform X1 [Pecten maximus]|uniref:uncharacterized protein LOC117321988 isoform X1 n=1 Tax=Pecten maximus TaxID=6579 RepID=UPI001458EBF7|nr:uncharacterized protein LOC117321988 isoform X1 [Pecten maximus]
MALDVMQRSNTSFEIPSPVPPGNWLAHQIRLLQDNSAHLLPQSAGSKRSWDKYNSTTHKDFCGPRDIDQWAPDFNSMQLPKLTIKGNRKPKKKEKQFHRTSQPFEKKRQTLAEILFGNKQNQMFTNWRVPQRFYRPHSVKDKYEPPVPRNDANVGVVTEEHERFFRPSSEASQVPSRAPSVVSARSPPPRLSRQMSLPELKMRTNQPRPLGMSRQYTRINKAAGTPVPVAKPEASKPQCEEDAKLGKEDFKTSLQPHVVDKADELLKLAPKADRKVIEKILKMADRKQQMENSLKKTMMPDAREEVEKWLTSANEDERQVALKFFNSLAGTKLMGITAAEQKKRLQQVIDTLEGASEKKGGAPRARNNADRSKAGKLQHLRLLSPQTRKERWMHTTWHHLPEYNDKGAGNWSSHYIRPQAPIPRHFVIHPDWG